MSRDSSGNYTLPAGNPVITGTNIASNWANTTLSDLGNEMTDSLSRSGKGSMNAQFKSLDGTVSAPGMAFGSEPTSGIYRSAAGAISVSILGSKIVTFSSTIPISITGPASTYPAFSYTSQIAQIGILNSSATNGGYISYETNSVEIGRIGSSLAAEAFGTNSDLVVATQGAHYLYFSTNGRFTGSIDYNGGWVVPIPNASESALVLNGAANSNTLNIVANSTSGQSYGLLVNAGTTTVDYASRITNQGGGIMYSEIIGNGEQYMIVPPAATTPPGGLYQVGYMDIPNTSVNSNYQLLITDRGKFIYINAANLTITIPANTTTAFPVGTVITICAEGNTGTQLTIGGTDILVWCPGGSQTIPRSLSAFAVATILKTDSNRWMLTGAGIS